MYMISAALSIAVTTLPTDALRVLSLRWLYVVAYSTGYYFSVFVNVAPCARP